MPFPILTQLCVSGSVCPHPHQRLVLPFHFSFTWKEQARPRVFLHGHRQDEGTVARAAEEPPVAKLFTSQPWTSSFHAARILIALFADGETEAQRSS